MLSTRYRFHGHGSLRFVYSKGKITRSKYFVCKYTVNSRREVPRIAIVISKKVLKSAVKRNRVRRRMYELLREDLPNLQERSDIAIIITSSETLTITHDELRSSLTRALAQAGLYKTPKN